ncbi:515_t:CDS:1, partial [Funneliformis geosporum]
MSKNVSIDMPPHNVNLINGSISMINISPKENYLATYGEENETFVVWKWKWKDEDNKNKLIDKSIVLKNEPEQKYFFLKSEHKLLASHKNQLKSITHMFISDKMILAYIDDQFKI